MLISIWPQLIAIHPTNLAIAQVVLLFYTITIEGCDPCNSVTRSSGSQNVDSRTERCTVHNLPGIFLTQMNATICIPTYWLQACSVSYLHVSGRKIEYRSLLLQEAIILVHSTKERGQNYVLIHPNNVLGNWAVWRLNAQIHQLNFTFSFNYMWISVLSISTDVEISFNIPLYTIYLHWTNTKINMLC